MTSLLLILVLSPFASQAAEPPSIQMSCVTAFPTTSYLVESQGEELVVRVIHHNGSKYAPAISGIFTPSDLPILAKRAALVEKMADDMTFRWPLKNCKKHEGMRFECYGTDDVQEGKEKAKIAPFALYTSKLSHDGPGGKFETVDVTMSFDVNGERDASIEMRYYDGECVPYLRRDI